MSEPVSSQPVKVESIKEPSLPAKKVAEKAEVKTVETAALGEPENAPETVAPVKPAKKPVVAAVSEPEAAPKTVASVKPMVKPVAVAKPEKAPKSAEEPVKVAAKASAETALTEPKTDAQLLTSVSDSPIRQVNYPVDGNPNFIRAWPYE